MSSSLLYHTQRIQNYQYESSEYINGRVLWNIRRKSFCCDKCGYPGVSISVSRKRLIKGEKKYLGKKFRRIPLKDVKVIGMDELYVNGQGKEKYITIVRDLESGAVLYVGDGKESESLNVFGKRLKHSKARISTVAMDMSKAYASWVKKNLPNTLIVFDHFHVIKLMNEKEEEPPGGLDEKQRALLKNQRFLFLRNVEDLEPDAKGLSEILCKWSLLFCK